MRIAVLTALILLAAVPVAAADLPWSAPRAASPAAAFFSLPGLVFAADGSGLISWNTGEPARGHLATLRPGGAIVQRGTLGGEVVAKPLVTGGRRTVVLTRKRRVAKQFRTLDQLTATFGTTASPRGRTRKVGGSHEVFGEDQGPAMASSGDEVAVGWVEKVGQERTATGSRSRVAAGVRPPADARDDAAADARLGEHRAGLRPRARARRRLQQRPREERRATGDQVPHPSPGRGLGGAHVLGDREPLTTLVAASNRIGQVVIAWGSQDSGEEASRPWSCVPRCAPAWLRHCRRARPRRHARLRAGGARRDHERRRLRRDRRMDERERPPGGRTFPLRTATRIGGGRFGAATEVSPNGVLGGLAVTTKNHGDVHLLAWTDAPPPNAEPHPPYDVFAALRPAPRVPSTRPSASPRPRSTTAVPRSPRSAPAGRPCCGRSERARRRGSS